MAINTTTDLNVVGTSQLVDESVTTDKLGALAVTAAKIDTGAVTETKIAADAVTAAKIATGAVGASELASASVGTAKIDSGAATSVQFLKASGSGGASFASVEGTAIASTGATAGHVLTAGAGGTTTTWSALPAGAGQLTFVSGTSAFSTATNNGGTALQLQLPNNVVFTSLTVTGGGSIVFGISDPETLATGSKTYTQWNPGLGTASAYSTAVAPVAAGTNSLEPTGQGYDAGGANPGVIIREWSRTVNTTTITIRKWTTGGVNSWNTQLFTGSSGLLAGNNAGPFQSYSGINSHHGKWAQGPGIWYGGDNRVEWTAGTTRECKAWIINDVSGSAYSAAFGSAAVTGAAITELVYIPSSTAAANGTIHAWGVVDSQARYVTYEVGSASISAIATANYTTGATFYDITDQWWFPIVGKIYRAHWLESESKVMIIGAVDEPITFTDRSIGTVLSESYPRQGMQSYTLFSQNFGWGPDSGFHEQSGWVTQNSGIFKFGSYDGMASPQGTAFRAALNTTSNTVLCGAGTPQFVVGSSSGTPYRWDLAGFAAMTVDAGSTANRMYTINGNGGNSRNSIFAIAGGGSGYPMNMGGSPLVNGNYSFVASGTGAVVVYATPLNAESTATHALVRTGAATRFQTAGGTGTINLAKISLA